MKNIVAIGYHSYKDPIMEGLLVQYLKGINHEKTHIHLITFEQKQYFVNEEERKSIQKALAAKNIYWIPKKYLTGGIFILFKKILNFLTAFHELRKINKRDSVNAVLGFTSLSGAISYAVSRFYRLKLIILCFEPHSMYMRDFKIWSNKSLSYIILRKLEKLQVKNADILVVPTRHTLQLVQQWGISGKLFQMPICVDENEFMFSNDARSLIRSKIGCGDKKVILYLGKFGGIYYSLEEVIGFYHQLYKANNSLFFYIITPEQSEIVEKRLEEINVPKENYSVSPVIPYNEVNQHISASDLGMLAVPSLPSQKYRTPIKTANYLLCGLPYLVNAGVSEDDEIAQKHKVGVVINSIDTLDTSTIAEINSLLSNDPTAMRQKCREIGIKYRSLGNMIGLLDQIFNEV